MYQKPFLLLFVFLLSFFPERMREKKLAASTLGPRHRTAENYGEIMNPQQSRCRPHETSQKLTLILYTHSPTQNKTIFPQKAKTTKMRNENKTDTEGKKGLSIDVEEISFRFTLVEVEVKKKKAQK